MTPHVSFFFPAYNDQAHLGPACESILSQTFEDWELLMADDASTDDSPDILEAFRGRDSRRIKTFRRPTHNRMEAWDQLFAMARGEYLCIAGADDVHHPDRFAAQVELLDRHPDVPLCFTDVHHIDNEGQTTTTVRLAPPEGRRRVAELLLKNYIYTPSVMMRRDAVEAAGGWLRHEFGFASDYHLWLRMSRLGPLAHLAEPLTYYRVHPRSLTVMHGVSRILQDVVRVQGEFYRRGRFPEWEPGTLDEADLRWMYAFLARALTPPTYLTGAGLEEAFVDFFAPFYRRQGDSEAVRALRAEAASCAAAAFDFKGNSRLAGEFLACARRDDPAADLRRDLIRQRHLLARSAERLWLSDPEGARTLMNRARMLFLDGPAAGVP